MKTKAHNAVRVVTAVASTMVLAGVLVMSVFRVEEGDEVAEEVEEVAPGFCGNQPVESRESVFVVRSSLSMASGSRVLNIEPLEHSEAVDDLVNVSAYGIVEIDVLDNDINFDQKDLFIRNRGNPFHLGTADNFFLEVTIPPKLGEARVIDFPGDWLYRVIEYENFSSGCDFFEYRACNTIVLCDTARVYVNAGLENCTILGTKGNDHLVGTPGDDFICGLAGDDMIDGMSGDDIILGGTGNDMIFGGDGDDRILGEIGNDRIQGGSGENLISGGDGTDRAYGIGGFDRYRWKERTLLTR